MNNIIVLSGGAKGADIIFGFLPDTTCYHFSFEGHTSSVPLNGRVVKIPQKDLDSRKEELREVFMALVRDYNVKSKFVENLLLRNMYQIRNKQFTTELVVAIADVYTREVSGGTNYAITKAIIERIPIVVLDKKTNVWYFYSYELGLFTELDKEINLNNFKVITGIGSRDTNKNNATEIYKCFFERKISNKEATNDSTKI